MLIPIIEKALNLLFNFLECAIFLEVILSWVAAGKNNKLTDLLHVFTEPFMGPARKIQQRFIPNLAIDFSPIFALLIIDVLRRIIFMIVYMFV
jgi:YggT family protein